MGCDPRAQDSNRNNSCRFCARTNESLARLPSWHRLASAVADQMWCLRLLDSVSFQHIGRAWFLSSCLVDRQGHHTPFAERDQHFVEITSDEIAMTGAAHELA